MRFSSTQQLTHLHPLPLPSHTRAQVLQQLRAVAASKGATISYLLDTKGPEIRTAMLRGGQNLSLSKDQEVLLVAVGGDYKTWEGGVNPETGAACA
jgi:pyruvate kinase